MAELNFFSPPELTENYSKSGVYKTRLSVGRMLMLGILAGILIGLGGAVTNTASHSLSNVSVQRIVSGLLFPFGLGMVVIVGAELFTGNCLIAISILEKKATIPAMLRNWFWVYGGNFIGALLLAYGCANFGQFNYSQGDLAVYTIKVAAAKCALPFGNALVLGFLCNLLVCLGVLMGLSAKDTAGKLIGCYFPVAYFVLCGFEHCIANMYYIPAGIFAMQIPTYAEKALEAGIQVAALNWKNFFFVNLLPVTIGNILGGVAVGGIMWAGHLNKKV